MPQINPFAPDAFNLVSMTESINIFPNKYGMLEKMGIFGAPIGTRSNVALIERRNGVLTLVPSTPLGGAPPVNVTGKRDMVTVPIPHLPITDMLLPQDVQGLRAFGTENQLETMSSLMASKLQSMSSKLDITLEYLRMGALKGIVIDGDGSTVLVNLFTAFGVTQQVQNIVLSSSTTDVGAAVVNIKRYLEDNLNGETMTDIVVLCSGGFWDALISHPKVVTAYTYWMNQPNIMRDDLRVAGFTYQGVTFVEYRGKASLPGGGGVVNFVPANEAIAIPLGTQDVFKTYYGPAGFNETVNTLGLPKYAKQEERRMGQGWDLWAESNPLAIATRPDLLVKITKS